MAKPCLIVALLLYVAPAAAETGFSANRFEPAERGSEWFVHDTLDLRGHLRPAAGMTLDWVRRTLAIYDLNTGDPNFSPVLHRLTANVGANMVLFDRLRVGFNMPLVLLNEGNVGEYAGVTYRSPWRSTTVGDLRLGADVRILGVRGDAFRLALGLQAWLPTGETYSYTGDGDIRLAPRAQVAGDVGRFSYAARLGYLYRAHKDTFAEVSIGNELSYGAGGGVHIGDAAFVGVEISSATRLTDSWALFGTRTTPVEGTLGAHYTLGDFRFGVAAAAGFTKSNGDPQYRLLASFDWAPAIATKSLPVAAPVPLVISKADEDGDGVPDTDDLCPAISGTADNKGCRDGDGDGVIDKDDRCPEAPGVASTDEKKNGCPADKDDDGVPDSKDACPDKPGEMREDVKTTGCPDTDKDSVPDSIDACLEKAGTVSEEAAKNGCPLVELKKDVIVIRDQVKFRLGRAEIEASDDGEQVLQAVLKILQDHPEIKIRIEGHTDNAGAEKLNIDLSSKRAKSVLDWLRGHGINVKRMASKGLGSKMPLAPNDSDANRLLNRRVEFHVVE